MMNNSAKWLIPLSLTLGIASGIPGFAQQDQPQPPSNGGWRKFGDSNPNRGYADDRDRDPDYQQAPPPGSANAFDPPPPAITIPAGTWITVRVDQPLSSDHNQPGDSFSATLVQPIVASGRVLSRRGQILQGRVAEAVKAGRASGISHLAIELTELALVDGQQFPVRTQLVERRGDTSVGRDIGAVGATAGVGAAIGGAAAGGLGAGLGAIAGAGAATIGVLSTRGRATVVYPETQLTFRLEEPVTVSTERSQQAFEPVSRDDYEGVPSLRQGQPPLRRGPGYYQRPGYYGPTPYYGGLYPFWGSSFYFYSRPRFAYGYGRGFRRW